MKLTNAITKISFMIVTVAVLCGCTSVQLRRNTVCQAAAVQELQQQEVLDNLAMFVVNPNALPYFTVAGAGQSSVTDQGSAMTSLNWVRSGFQSVGLTLSGNRLMQENFTLAPLNDPDKLARMRCAYQSAVGFHGGPCIDCYNLEKQLGPKSWTGQTGAATCPNDCSPHPGWFCVGPHGSVPKNACLVGKYGSTYVWVPPQGTDEFARLTLTILDYATAVPPAAKTKTVKTTLAYQPGPDGTVKTVEETQTVPLAAVTTATMDTTQMAMPLQPEVPLRRDYFVPQQLPQVVIPLQ